MTLTRHRDDYVGLRESMPGQRHDTDVELFQRLARYECVPKTTDR